jgi:hypothetical protein
MISTEIVEKVGKHISDILRLGAWDIEYAVMNELEFMGKAPDEMTKDAQGFNRTDATLNLSQIFINIDSCEDWYATLIHELLHLTFAPIETAFTVACNISTKRNSDAIDDMSMVAIESVVERLAQTIVILYPKEKALLEVGCEVKNG